MERKVMAVRVGKLPGRINDVQVDYEDGNPELQSTVARALQGADVGDTSGYEIRVNGVVATENTVLKDLDLVLLLRKIAGN